MVLVAGDTRRFGSKHVARDRMGRRTTVAASPADRLGRSSSRRLRSPLARNILLSDLSYLIRPDQIIWLRKSKETEQPPKRHFRSSSAPPRLHPASCMDSDNQLPDVKCSAHSCLRCRPHRMATMSRKPSSPSTISTTNHPKKHAWPVKRHPSVSSLPALATDRNGHMIRSTHSFNPNSLSYKIKAGVKPRNLSPGSKALENHNWLCRIIFS